MTRRKPILLFVAIALSTFPGCADRAPARYPVRGQLFRGGKPVAEAVIVLHSLTPSVEVTQKPIAYTDSDGRFEMATLQAGDGAPPGDYVITVELRAPKMIGEELVRDGPGLLPDKYAKPKLSPLRCTVVEGENEIPAIDLKG